MITRNRSREAVRAVERLIALPENPPVIVVDNGSSDCTVAALARFRERVTVIALGRNAGAAGRNVGVEAASTPYVAFVDDDSSWAPGSLARAAEVLAAYPRLAVLAARVMVGEPATLDPTCHTMSASPLPADPSLPGPPILGFVACGAVVRRDAFLIAGGFDEHYGVGGEESLLAIELASRGWKLAYVDRVTAHHWPSPVRDHAARRRVLVRNELWLAWSRRAWWTALRVTGRLLKAAATDTEVRSGVIAAARQSGRILKQRRRVDADLEELLRIVD